MGHSTFAYITDYDGTPAGMREAYQNLHRWPPESSDDAWTDHGGYSIADLGSHRVLQRPADMPSEKLERLARSIIRNCKASHAFFEESFKKKTFDPNDRYKWDDQEAFQFLMFYAQKWEPGIVMPIDAERCFVFGIAGG